MTTPRPTSPPLRFPSCFLFLHVSSQVRTVMAMDSTHLASTAMAFHTRRQLQGLTLTPEQLAQIQFDNKSTLTTLVWTVSCVAIGIICVIVPTRLILRQRTTGRLLVDDSKARVCSLPPVSKLTLPSTHYTGLHLHFGCLRNGARRYVSRLAESV